MKRTLRGDRNQCPTCGEYFNSTRAFDKHRTGGFSPNTRRCLNTVEMSASGMVKNQADWWVSKASNYQFPAHPAVTGRTQADQDVAT